MVQVGAATRARGTALTASRFAILVVLVPGFLEGIDDRVFAVQIPFFPLSVGSTGLVVAGLLSVFSGMNAYLWSPAAKGLALVVIGCCVGALFSGDVVANLSRTAGLGLLLAAAAGMASLWSLRPFRRALDLFLGAGLVYWLLYVAEIIVGTGGASYTLLGASSQVDLRNHHIPGIYISFCGVYIALRYFHRDGRLGLGGFGIFAVVLAACLYIESRSNFGFTLFALLLVMIQERRRIVGRLFVVVPLLLATYFGLAAIFESSEGIQRRFEETSQTQATDSRVGLALAGVETLIANPLGRGILNYRVEFGGLEFNIHNQYLTYGVAGGLLAMCGVLLWLWDYGRILQSVRVTAPGALKDRYMVADAMMLLTMYATLLTIELAGVLFFIVLSVGCYRSGLVATERRQRKALARRLDRQDALQGPVQAH